jgi:hypothetical protein
MNDDRDYFAPRPTQRRPPHADVWEQRWTLTEQ